MAATTYTVKNVSTEAEFDEQLSHLSPEALAVVYFHASWAEPCKQMSTVLSTLASTYNVTTPRKIAFLSLDAEEVTEVSERYDVTQVPLVVLQKGGQVVESITGTDASKLRSSVERYVSNTQASNGLPPAQKVVQPPVSSTNAQPPSSSDANKVASQTNGTISALQEESQEDLHKRLGELVKAAPVMLFMKGTPSAPQCGFSRQTVSLLREKGIRYGFFNILADDEVRQGLKTFSDWPTFPQLYVDGELVGGLDIIKEEFENDVDFLSHYSARAAQTA